MWIPRRSQQVTSSRHPERTIVSLSDLSNDDKGMFKKGHGDNCPGMVKVDFYGDGKPAFALALITKSVSKGKTELAVAHLVGAIWEITTLETADCGAPVWSEKPGEYKDVYGEKKLRATNPVIVFCKYEPWAIL